MAWLSSPRFPDRRRCDIVADFPLDAEGTFQESDPRKAKTKKMLKSPKLDVQRECSRLLSSRPGGAPRGPKPGGQRSPLLGLFQRQRVVAAEGGLSSGNASKKSVSLT